MNNFLQNRLDIKLYNSNFVLENYNIRCMKSFKLLFLCGLVGTIVFSISFYRLSASISLENMHYFVFALVLFTMIVSTLIYFRRLRDESKGIPSQDELSLAISSNAARDSFPYSYGLWMTILIIAMFSDHSVILIGSGIIGMAIIYVLFWLYHKRKGLSND